MIPAPVPFAGSKVLAIFNVSGVESSMSKTHTKRHCLETIYMGKCEKRKKNAQ
tara:strand:+ start:315 stop:473 length:159 start_codon:yes stop_codon:yes gene_type:complete